MLTRSARNSGDAADRPRRPLIARSRATAPTSAPLTPSASSTGTRTRTCPGRRPGRESHVPESHALREAASARRLLGSAARSTTRRRRPGLPGEPAEDMGGGEGPTIDAAPSARDRKGVVAERCSPTDAAVEGCACPPRAWGRVLLMAPALRLGTGLLLVVESFFGTELTQPAQITRSPGTSDRRLGHRRPRSSTNWHPRDGNSELPTLRCTS